MDALKLGVAKGGSILVGLIAWAAIASSAHAGNELERLADRIEDKADRLQDLVDDDFERSPDYRSLRRLANRLEDATDDLEDHIGDREFPCALQLMPSIHSDLAVLEGIVAEQQPCYVCQESVSKTLCIVREMYESLECLSAAISGACPPTGCITRPTQPSHHSVGRFPVRFGGYRGVDRGFQHPAIIGPPDHSHRQFRNGPVFRGTPQRPARGPWIGFR